MKGGDKKKACSEFLTNAQLNVEESQLIPRDNLTTPALYNISDENKNKLIQVFSSVDPATMLIIILGEEDVNSLKNESHDVMNQEIVKSFEGKATVLFIDPAFYSVDQQVWPIPEEFKAKVSSIQTIQGKFPLTPVFGPHKYYWFPKEYNTYDPSEKFAFSKIRNTYQQSEEFKKLYSDEIKSLKNKNIQTHGTSESLRRLVHKNALEVLNILVAFKNPILIDSRITSICYRSFKYLIDIRALHGRKTHVLYEYTAPHSGSVKSCNTEYAIFPDPFSKCKEETQQNDLEKYYYSPKFYRYASEATRKKLDTKKTPEKKLKFKESIDKVNAWANQELRKYIPLENSTTASSVSGAGAGSIKGGKRKTRKNRKH